MSTDAFEDSDPRSVAFQIAFALSKRVYGSSERMSPGKAEQHAILTARLYRQLTSISKQDENTPDLRRRADAIAFNKAFELSKRVYGSTKRFSEEQAVECAASIRKLCRILTLQEDAPIESSNRRSKRSRSA